MTATTAKYVRVLWELKAPVEDLETAVQIYRESPELQRVLTDPSVYKEEKHAVVDRIFPGKKLQNFMKILCDYMGLNCACVSGTAKGTAYGTPGGIQNVCK